MKSFHLKIPPALRSRLEALKPRLRIRVKRGSTDRDAHLTEVLVLAAEHLAADMEAGRDVLAGSVSFAGAVQRATRKGKMIARAPLTSARVYAELMASPRVPTPEEIAALDADAELLGVGDKVRVRGSVFHTGPDLVTFEGTVEKAQRGRTGPLVKMQSNLTIEISPYDLVPSVLWDEHLAAVAAAEGGGP